jgi:thymidine phosphorylase
LSFGNAIHDAIEIKKFGDELSEELISAVVAGYTSGEVPDYQMASLLMAIFIKGMTYEENATRSPRAWTSTRPAGSGTRSA